MPVFRIHLSDGTKHDIDAKTPDAAAPADGYGAGFLEYSIRTSFRDLCALIGRENAEREVAEIIDSERARRRQ